MKNMHQEQDLLNAAYTDTYKEKCASREFIFDRANYIDSEVVSLPNGYTIENDSYYLKVDIGGIYSAKISTLKDADGKKLHHWKCYDDNALFYDFVEHRNGNTYFVFRQELYGYSIFDLENNKGFQYYPSCVLNKSEAFIWAGIEEYNPDNNTLAVTGCYWAAPWSVLIVDFSEPLKTPKFQLDMRECTEGEYENFDDIDFDMWKGDKIVLNCSENDEFVEVIVEPKRFINRV